jgi:hypothetical protein
MVARTVNYIATQGIPFKRIVILKSKSHHRLMVPTAVKAQIQSTSTSKKKLNAELTGAGEILLSLTAAETAELPIGELEYDVLAQFNDTYYRVSAGVISVEANTTVTDRNEAKSMELRMDQYEDFRKTFTWKDSAGVIQTVTSAYLQAKNTAGTTVLDLRWFASAPIEATILALPATQRGYLAPKVGCTLEMHISDKNTIPAGTHSFDLFVKDSQGDWEKIAAGTIVVNAAISTNPYA